MKFSSATLSSTRSEREVGSPASRPQRSRVRSRPQSLEEFLDIPLESSAMALARRDREDLAGRSVRLMGLVVCGAGFGVLALARALQFLL